MKDTFKHRGLRRQLLLELKEKGIDDQKVLEAINQVPRHLFFLKNFEQFAYEDKAYPIESGQTISQPYTVAFQTMSLEIKPGEKILEIGTGSGYQGAVLSKLGAEVHSIERDEKLFHRTAQLLSELAIPIKCYLGDGTKGLPSQTPFDKIIVTAGAPDLTDSLMQQLRVGGKMISPVGDKNVQKMILAKKTSSNNYSYQDLGTFKFVPLIGEHGWKN
ncbi:MAG: Protein-L-isoaspartate O-methyltransferase [Bacteroidetes bacterium MED-G17]|nr:MAG: protein-L-isoaspartate O-methyltransferase [Bacteroidetes bacterium TMED39]CAI8258145.1 MAG: Protein-L-isoaspartate O-methyltransferase [Bacteroidetes bacterium MED-G17]